MRLLAVLFLAIWSVLSSGCSEYVCDEKTGKTACSYCAQDRLATGNPHAGTCRYCPGNTHCSGDSCTDELMCQSKANIFVPRATFRTGAAPTGSGASTVPAVVLVTPSSNSLTMGSTVQWTVQWDVALAVTAVLLDAPQLGGYFELPVTPDESNAGVLVVPMVEASEAPGESGCLGPMTCWKEAPAETTTADLAVALVGEAGEVGQSMGGIGLTWATDSFPQSTGTADPGNGCPASAADLGCCTTRGGIQIVGAGVSSPCSCPSGTCSKGGGYCGCPGCGGC